MAYRSIPDFQRLPSDARFEIAKPLLWGLGMLQPGDPVPHEMSPRRMRQFYEQRKIRVLDAPANIQIPAVAGRGKTK